MLDNYELRPDGVLKQKTFFNKIQEYDNTYVNERYNTYGELGMRMAYLRLGYITAAWESYTIRKLNKVLDVGYGNGDFLKACSEIIPNCCGSDVSGYPIPDKCTYINDIFTEEFDVITFFDVLEHFEDIDVIKNLKTKMIIISVPECHYPTDDEWFKNWKHRRPDEHLYHFNRSSLSAFFRSHGYRLQTMTNLEDSIRKPYNPNLSNILTASFIKQ